MQQKCETIKRLDKGETMQMVADDYGVGRVIILGDWVTVKAAIVIKAVDRWIEIFISQ